MRTGTRVRMCLSTMIRAAGPARVLASVAVLVLVGLTNPARLVAAPHGGGGHGGAQGSEHGGEHGRETEGGLRSRGDSGHFHERDRDRWGGAYPYAYPYASPPVFTQPSSQYWYYCGSANAYYPYVSECPEGWTPVVP